MFLLEILAALALIQFWSGHNPLHRDGWFKAWLSRLQTWSFVAENPYLLGAIALFIPVLAIGLLVGAVPAVIGFLISVLLLVYATGRGEFADEVAPYNAACNDGDWDLAARAAARQGVDTDYIERDNWAVLHEKMLEATAYQGFERLFAVVFWYTFLGPMGAVLYRLSHLFKQALPSEVTSHWLWALEWVPVRVLGVSFAITGNFVGCVNRWRQHLFCPSSGSGWVLMQAVLGALSVDDELMQSCDVSQREVSAIKQLYVRTLWFWLAALALWVLFGPVDLLV